MKWEEEARKNDKILENISEFKTRAGGKQRELSLDDDSIFGYMDYYDSIPEWDGHDVQWKNIAHIHTITCHKVAYFSR